MWLAHAVVNGNCATVRALGQAARKDLAEALARAFVFCDALAPFCEEAQRRDLRARVGGSAEGCRTARLWKALLSRSPAVQPPIGAHAGENTIVALWWALHKKIDNFVPTCAQAVLYFRKDGQGRLARF